MQLNFERFVHSFLMNYEQIKRNGCRYIATKTYMTSDQNKTFGITKKYYAPDLIEKTESYKTSPSVFEWWLTEEKFYTYFGFHLNRVKVLEHTLVENEILIVTFLDSKNRLINSWPFFVKEYIIEINKEWLSEWERLESNKRRYDDFPI